MVSLFQAFDLTNEDDIKRFILLYKTIHKKVKNQTVKNIVKARLGDDEDAAELFKRMVEEYNSSLLPIDDDSEEEETED